MATGGNPRAPGGPPVRAKRVYEPPAKEDGLRVLVDRLWPRGLSRERARIDLRTPELAPSPDLRRWFGHDPERFDEFRRRYLEELDDRANEMDALLERAGEGPLTLLFAAADTRHNHAVVLAQALARRGGRAD